MSIPALNIDLFLLVFMRMTGFVVLNPVFGRSSVPTILKVAFSLLCAFIITPTLHIATTFAGVPQMFVALLSELAVGLAIGMVLNILFAVVTMAGEFIDYQMGLSMAMMYDPGSGVNMPIIGNYFNILLMVVFFAGNAHLSLLSMVTDSFRAIAPGTVFPTAASARFVASMGKDMLELGLRMAIPIIVVEIVGIVAIGLLMKAVPQINVFTVGIQIQMIVGVLILLFASPMIVLLCDRLTAYMLEKTAECIRLMAG